MLGSVTSLRGRIKTGGQDISRTHYKFNDESIKNIEEREENNRKLVEKLLHENSFHFHVRVRVTIKFYEWLPHPTEQKHFPEKPAGPYYCEAIPQLIAKTFFDCEKSAGTKFPNYFHPMPLQTIALMITTVRICSLI